MPAQDESKLGREVEISTLKLQPMESPKVRFQLTAL